MAHLASFHKRLRNFYEPDDARGLNPNWLSRIRRILTVIEAAKSPDGADIPGFYLHPLKGNLNGFWSVRVTGNWRIIWRFDEEGNATDVDLVDYH
ncbi:MAG: type II toxin-antitoxin system RelE/ParE family toxin [Bacteroidota bacterium]